MELDWANLEALALSLILDKLEERIDHVWFGAVCKNWRSIAKFNHQNHEFRTNVLPLLMISTKSNSNEVQRRLYGIPTDRVYSFQLPDLNDYKVCYGSSHGWVATMDHDNHVVILLNPFKHIAPISLPPLKSVLRVTLSADPITSPDDYGVVAIHGTLSCLACIRAGQTFWTYVRHDYIHFSDAIFYKGQVFAVNEQNMIVSFPLHYLDKPFLTDIAPNVVLQENRDLDIHDVYLVKSLKGDLWMVRRSLEYPGKVVSFNTYKLELDAQNGKLQQMLKLESLEDNVLFLGRNDSISVSASYYSKCLSKDSIYFANDLKIYNIKDGSIRHPRRPYSLRTSTSILDFPTFPMGLRHRAFQLQVF